VLAADRAGSLFRLVSPVKRVKRVAPTLGWLPFEEF
jgi:hypothetical protein